jgi:hypothetical protein
MAAVYLIYQKPNDKSARSVGMYMLFQLGLRDTIAMADWSTRAGERTEAEEACGGWRSYRCREEMSGQEERGKTWEAGRDTWHTGVQNAVV